MEHSTLTWRTWAAWGPWRRPPTWPRCWTPPPPSPSSATPSPPPACTSTSPATVGAAVSFSFHVICSYFITTSFCDFIFYTQSLHVRDILDKKSNIVTTTYFWILKSTPPPPCGVSPGGGAGVRVAGGRGAVRGRPNLHGDGRPGQLRHGDGHDESVLKAFFCN